MFYCHCSRCKHFSSFVCTVCEAEKNWTKKVLVPSGFAGFYWEMKCSCNYSSLRQLSTFFLWFRFYLKLYFILFSTVHKVSLIYSVNIKLFSASSFVAFFSSKLFAPRMKYENSLLKRRRNGKYVYGFQMNAFLWWRSFIISFLCAFTWTSFISGIA